MWRARVNVLKTHYGLYARFSLKIVASKQAFNGWSDAHANSSSRGSRVLLGVTLFTRTEAIHRKICRMRRREHYIRDAQCTLRAECKTRTTRVTLCILANWLLRAVMTYLSFSFSLYFSSSLCRNVIVFFSSYARQQLRKLRIFTAVLLRKKISSSIH